MPGYLWKTRDQEIKLRHLIKSNLFAFALLLLLSGYALAATPSIPQGVSLEVSGTSIKVKWTANTDSTEGYKISYGTSSTALTTSKEVSGKNTTSYTFEELEPLTTYYFAVAAYIGSETGSNSTTVNATTGTGPSKPSTPENFKIQSLDSITDTSITVTWKEDTTSDLLFYRVYYGTSAGHYSAKAETEGANLSAFEVGGLESGKRYFFALTSVNTDRQESDKSSEIAADTTPDTLAPPAPEITFAGIAGTESITIKIKHPVPGLADIKGTKILYGTNPGVYDSVPIDIGEGTNTTISGLTQNVTYYFVAKAYDYYNNESGYSAEKKVVIEKSKTLLSDDNSFSGCFVSSSDAKKDAVAALGIMAAILFIAADFFKKYRAVIIVAVIVGILAPVSPAAAIDGNNTIALKWGYFKPSESLYEDVYDNNSSPVTLLYERKICDNILADIEAGYMWKSGYAVTVSGEKTGVKTELTLIPVSIGAQYEYEIMPFVSIFGGLGGELWYVNEDPSDDYFKSNDGTISGWFVKGGLKLFTQSEMFEGAGLILESKYSAVSRFGDNDTDLGGLMLNAGLFYRF